MNRPSFEHRLRAGDQLLGRLADEHSVPDQRVRSPAMIRAVLIHAAMWTSWPHACITPTSAPVPSLVRTVLAYGKPGGLGHGQRVEFGPQHHGRPGAVLEHADDAGAADAGGHVVAQLAQARSPSWLRSAVSLPDSSG